MNINISIEDDYRLTPTQIAILRVLSDNEPHTREELHRCLNDDLASLKAIQPQLSRLRAVLRRFDQGIMCDAPNGVVCYRRVWFRPTNYNH